MRWCGCPASCWRRRDGSGSWGPYTVAVLPLTLLVNAILYRYQRRRVFNVLGLRVRRNAVGFVAFVLTYQMLMSPVSVAGYVQELLGLRRRWK